MTATSRRILMSYSSTELRYLYGKSYVVYKMCFHERVLTVLDAQNILNLVLYEFIASGNYKRPKQCSLFNNIDVIG
jgi:hypothetical protein